MDQLAIELIVDDTKATVKLDKFGQKVHLISDDINKIGGDKQFAGKISTDLDALTKRADATYQSFRQIANLRLDSGNVGVLTREILTAQTRSRQLASDIVNIRRELGNPARSSSIAFLTTELKAAERELTSLTRKLQNVRAPSVNPSAAGQSGGFGDAFSSRVFGSAFSGGAAGGFIGGVAGGAVIATKELVGSLISEVKDLGIESVRLAGNFEQATNSIAVFAGSTSAARLELQAIDKVALDTPGLRLEDAEKGYQRLRALNFEAGISRDLIKGLGTQRVLSGASADAVDRVITNLIQLKTGAGTAADVRQTVGQLPTLLPVFKKAFGTQDFGDINKIFKTDPQALQKFTDELAKAQTAQAGLNVSIEKGKDALIQSGRVFGEPFLKPLTRDVQNLTQYLRDNETTIRKWGQSVADTYNGISLLARQPQTKVVGTVGLALIGGLVVAADGLRRPAERTGQMARERQEATDRAENFRKGIEGGVSSETTKYVFDQITNTVRALPSVAEQLKIDEAAKKADELAKNIQKVKEQLSEFGFKVESDDISQNLERQKAIAVREAKGDSLKLTRETAALEIDALRQQISLSDRLTASKLKNLSPEDRAAGNNLLIAQENAANIGKLNAQIALTQINAQRQQTDEAKKLKDEFRDSLISLKSADNPLVKQMADLETATDRARLKFGAFGDDVVNKIAAIERANLNKAIGLQQFENNSNALRFDQDARRLAATPERQFADFQRSLERVNQTVDFTKTVGTLNRQISEADYYADKFNPNNPKTFAEFNRRGPNDDISAVGLDIRSAVEDIKNLSGISLEGTGALGRGAIADKILSSIPSRDELLKRLNSPFADVRGNADFLLQAQSSALIDKRDFEKQKFNNFLEDQKTAEFGKQFAREQIGLINGSKLTDVEKAKRRLAVTDALGNDLDPQLKRQKIQDSIASRNDQLDKNSEALKATTEIRDAVQAIVKQLAEKGIKIDASDMPAPQVNVELNGVEGKVSQNSLPAGATLADVADAYFDQNAPNYRIGDAHKAGSLYGLTK